MRLTTRGVRFIALDREVVVRVFVTVEAPEVGPTVRRRPSQEPRVAAARVRGSSDRQAHRPTPQWIMTLANSDVPDASVGRRHGDKRPIGWFGRRRRR